MNILVAGQSNAGRWFRGRAEGERSFVSAFKSAGRRVNLINAAAGGTSLLPVKPRYWLDTSPGSLYDNAITLARNAGRIQAIIWIQGEADAQGGVGRADYQRGLETLFGRFRRDLGNVPIYVQPLILGRFQSSPIVDAQMAYAGSDPLTKIVKPNMDRLHAVEIVHFSQNSYGIIANKFARHILRDLGMNDTQPLSAGDMSALL